MFTREIATYRIDDMVRAAETHRRSASSAAARRAAHRGRIRRFGAVAASVVLWPFRH